MNDLKQIENLEEELRLAMLAGDVNKLDTLISDDLIFTDHTGAIYTKEMDIHAHRSGDLKIAGLDPEHQKIQLYEDTAIVSVEMRIKGTFTGEAFSGNSRYTRVWVKNKGQWLIVAAHASLMTDPEYHI